MITTLIGLIVLLIVLCIIIYGVQQVQAEPKIKSLIILLLCLIFALVILANFGIIPLRVR